MKPKIIIKVVLSVLVIVYLFLFFASSTGYYQYRLSKKTDLTNEAIERFEQDIKAGKQVDINDYIEEEINYDNSLTKMNKKISTYINKVFEGAFDYLFKYIDSSTNK